MLWYTTSESYCAPTPASDVFSASGIPSLSKVFFMSSGTSSQELFSFDFGLTYVAISSILSSDKSGPQVGSSSLLYTSSAFNLNSFIHAGSFFCFDISSIISGVKPFFILNSYSSLFFISYIFRFISSMFVFDIFNSFPNLHIYVKCVIIVM